MPDTLRFFNALTFKEQEQGLFLLVPFGVKVDTEWLGV